MNGNLENNVIKLIKTLMKILAPKK